MCLKLMNLIKPPICCCCGELGGSHVSVKSKNMYQQLDSQLSGPNLEENCPEKWEAHLIKASQS